MSRNLPLSGLEPLHQALTGEDLLLISQNTSNGWKSFSVEIAEFFNLAFAQGGVADYLDFLRDVKLKLNSGLTGNGTSGNPLGVNYVTLDDRYVRKADYDTYKLTNKQYIDQADTSLQNQINSLTDQLNSQTPGTPGTGGLSNPALAELLWPVGCKITTVDKTFNPSVAYANIFGYTTRWKLCKGIGVNANDINLDPGMSIGNPNSKNINMAHNEYTTQNTHMSIITQDFQMANGVDNPNIQISLFGTGYDELTHGVNLLSRTGSKRLIDYLFFNEGSGPTNIMKYKAFTRFFNSQFQWLRIGDQEPTYTITANKAVAKYDTAGVDFTITTANVPNGTQVKLFARFDWSNKVVANNLTEFIKVHEVVCVVIENNTANFNLKLATSNYTYTYTDKLLELVVIPEDTIYAPLEQVYFSLPISSGPGTPTLQIILTDVSSQYGGRPGSIFRIKVVWSGISNMSGQKVNFVIWGAAVGDQWASGGALFGISMASGFPNNPSVMIHNTGSTPTYNGANAGAFKPGITVSSDGFGEYNHPSLFFIEDALSKEVASGSTASFKAYLGDNINSSTMESAVVVKAFNHPRG